jgi:predicted phage baseplate assembly protein
MPKLDDRTFQDLVDEAKKRIPQYCPEWTEHNVSDPGITLIELFAWMTEILLYRLNQVPELHMVKFMELLGISLKGPCAAKVPVTIWLAAPQPTEVVIPAGTEVSSTQTQTEAPVTFTTTADFTVLRPELVYLGTRTHSAGAQAVYKEHTLRRLEPEKDLFDFEDFEAFSNLPQVDDALYFGFKNNLSDHILGFEMDFDPAGGAGVNPAWPPYIWEASTGQAGQHWQVCAVDEDRTRGMNSAGRIRLHLPKMGRYETAGKALFWVRARVREITPPEHRLGMRPYRLSPRLRSLGVAAWGGTVPAAHSQTIRQEELGRSDGTPGQRFKLKHTPVLDRLPGERLLVRVDGREPEPWFEVKDFALPIEVKESIEGKQHYTLDSLSGEVRLGPAVRQRDGKIKRYGAILPRGAALVFESYRTGGGLAGNVGEGILNTLKTSNPFISKVLNRETAQGGLDAESMEDAMVRAPALLRTHDRAVTEADFEFLARQALREKIGRVKCLYSRSGSELDDESGSMPSERPSDAELIAAPGEVILMVIPRVNHLEGVLTRKQLELNEADKKTLMDYLDERRLLTTKLTIIPPKCFWVAVKVRLKATEGEARKLVTAAVKAKLHAFLNPLTGGPKGSGWPYGRDLYQSDLIGILQGLPNIQYIERVEMYEASEAGEPQGNPQEERLKVPKGRVIISGLHSVEFS